MGRSGNRMKINQRQRFPTNGKTGKKWFTFYLRFKMLFKPALTYF